MEPVKIAKGLNWGGGSFKMFVFFFNVHIISLATPKLKPLDNTLPDFLHGSLLKKNHHGFVKLRASLSK